MIGIHYILDSSKDTDGTVDLLCYSHLDILIHKSIFYCFSISVSKQTTDYFKLHEE